MNRNLLLMLALVGVIVGPIALRPRQDSAMGSADDTVVIITPHNESIRYEFRHAFAKWYYTKTGRRVLVDYRTPGGTSEIIRYVDSEFVASFQHYWESKLHSPWDRTIQGAFMDSGIVPDATPDDDTPQQKARRAFLASEVGCKIDVFFGGGSYDFTVAANKGQLVDSGFIAKHPEMFGTGSGQIPMNIGGEPFYDAKGRWIGCVLSSFGMVYNTDVLARLGITQAPRRWSDLANPKYSGQIALANPTMSGSINRAFEMLVQQEIAEGMTVRGAREDDPQTIAAGWARAMRLLQRIGANARYFTDSATKPSLDVGAGDCAAGMTIDFYGRFQVDAVTQSGGSQFHYVDAEGGTGVGVDPIGLYRGAPHPEAAREFIAFVMSDEGQKLWNWKLKEPGGPERYALRRLPVQPRLYGDEFAGLRSDPDVRPYEQAKGFRYHPAWTGPLFGAQALIVRTMCIDTHAELTEAWRALVAAGFPPKAQAAFENVDHVSYAIAMREIKPLSGSRAPKIEQVKLAKKLADQFRANYVEAARLARAGE